MKKKIAILLTVLGLLPGVPQAQTVPAYINYQGTVTDSNGVGLGQDNPVNRKIIFRFWQHPSERNAAQRLWTEEQTVTIAKGQFSVLLGLGIPATVSSVTESRPDLDTIFTSGSTDRYLGITVDNGDNIINDSDVEITPRQRITSTAYCMRAQTADSIAAGADLQLNGSANYGLGHYGGPGGRLFGGANVNGPVLYGQSGGALGSVDGATKNIALQWDASNNVTLSGTITGNGSGLTQLNASQITTGTLADTRLSANVVLQNSAPTFINPTVANLEVRSVGSTPYIDFSRTADDDYQARIILNSNHLGLEGNVTFYNNVGIGTTAPGSRLQVNGDSNSLIRLGRNGSADIGLDPNANPQMLLSAPSGVRITNGLQVLSGNVGIGTASPVTRLHVEGAGDTEISLVSTDNNRRWTVQAGGAATPSFQIIDRTANLSRLSINAAGNVGIAGRVGIGTDAPVAPLHVVKGGYAAGAREGKDTSYGVYLSGNGSLTNADGSHDEDGDNWTISYDAIGLLVDGQAVVKSALWIAGDINQSSDARAKKILRGTDSFQDLDTLMKLQVTDYMWIDRTKDQRLHKKLIAQQVEKVFPQAVGVSEVPEVVPNVYEMAQSVLYNPEAGTLTVTTRKTHGFSKGDKVNLYADKHELKGAVIQAVVSPHQFVVQSDKPVKLLFVYGREVKDFRTVDYDAISMLNVSATQQIKKEKDAEVKALQDKNEALIKRVAILEAKDKARDAKLAAIEKLLLLPADKPSALPVSLRTQNGAE